MNNIEIKKLKRYSKLLKDKDIKKIIEERLIGYSISTIEKCFGKTVLRDERGICNQEILFKSENIVLIKSIGGKLQIATIKDGPEIEEINYDFRPKGVIVSKNEIKYGWSNYSSKYKVPISLISKSYVIDCTKGFELVTSNLNSLYDNHLNFINKYLNTSNSKMITTFETFMVNEDVIPDFKGPRDTLYSTHTFVNDRDVSHLYDIVKGPDKLLRIFDLYNGIINERNMRDIKSIHLGLLSEDAFGYKELRGIKKREDSIVSKSEIKPREEYLENISNLISVSTWYNKEIKSLDRKTLISAIKYVPKAPEIAKRNIEKVVGMSYDEFDMLDIEEQEKLIEEKTGKKITYPNDVYVDGYPISKINIDDEIERIVGIKKRKIKNAIKKDKNSN